MTRQPIMAAEDRMPSAPLVDSRGSSSPGTCGSRGTLVSAVPLGSSTPSSDQRSPSDTHEAEAGRAGRSPVGSSGRSSRSPLRRSGYRTAAGGQRS